MESEFNFDKLYDIARQELLGIDRLALAVSGSPYDLALIKIAAEVLCPQNVLVITADTGLITESEWSLIEKACDTAEVSSSVIFVDTAINFDPHTKEYKQNLFRELLHEAWMQGFETLACGCTKENHDKNGNEAALELGVIYPFLDE